MKMSLILLWKKFYVFDFDNILYFENIKVLVNELKFVDYIVCLKNKWKLVGNFVFIFNLISI